MQAEATTTEPVTQAVETIKEAASQSVEQVTESAQKTVESAAEAVTGSTPETVAEEPNQGTEAAPAADQTQATEAAAPETGEAASGPALEVPTTGGPQIGPADVSPTAESSIIEKATEAAGGVPEVVAISPIYTFLMGIGLLALFVWYFGSEKEKRRRLVGSILAVAVALLCSLFFAKYPIQKGIELRGGVSMDVQIEKIGERTIDRETQQEVVSIVEKRLNKLGTNELAISPDGRDGIFIQLPGANPEEVAEIEKQITKVAKLEFALVRSTQEGLAKAIYDKLEPEIPGFVALPFKLGEEEIEAQRKLVGPDVEIEDLEPVRFALVPRFERIPGKHVNSARPQFGTNGWSLSVGFDNAGANLVGPMTRANQGRNLAIILDDVIISAPTINEPFSSGCQITGDFTKAEAAGLAAALENPLENGLTITNSNYITASLGAATVRQGIYAGVAGLVATLLFILVYYKFAGIIALIGLLLNIAIIFGLLALFQFTLTLPGIAGIILTIGVAIDANVLIYERYREERKAGKSLKAAIDTAYEKAFSAIVDANITTLITAVILYFLATGTVKGFAITLIIGICASLFSALIVTRICFAWSTDLFLKDMKFLNVVPDKIINFLGKQKLTMVASIALVIISVLAVALMDPRGVELKGGDKVTVEVDGNNISGEQIKNAYEGLDLQLNPIMQKQQPVGGTGTYYVIRVANGDGEKVKTALKDSLGLEPKTDAEGNLKEPVSISSVGAQVGDAMLRSSIIAIVVGLAVILLYVTLRFEFAFALGAIVALFHDLIIVLGVLTLLQQELSLITVGALLTIAGYSINDTIVVFDRVREGLATRRGDVRDIMNYCLNATMARTILTSATTLLIVVVLFLFGGPGMRNFALTLIIGVVVGTYSSIFVASPIVLWWANRTGTNLRREVLDTEQAKIDPMTTA